MTAAKKWTDVDSALSNNNHTMHFRKGGYSSHSDVDYFSATKRQSSTRARAIISGPDKEGAPFLVTGWYEQNHLGNVDVIIDRHSGKTQQEAFDLLMESLLEQLKRAKSKGGRFPKGAKAYIMRRNSNYGMYKQRVIDAESASLIHSSFRREYAIMGFGMLKLG